MKIIVIAAQPGGVMFAVEEKYDFQLIMTLLSQTLETCCNAAPTTKNI